jgi:hypothetical protein
LVKEGIKGKKGESTDFWQSRRMGRWFLWEVR